MLQLQWLSKTMLALCAIKFKSFFVMYSVASTADGWDFAVQLRNFYTLQLYISFLFFRFHISLRVIVFALYFPK